MPTTEVTRTLAAPADALWRLVRAFGDLSWVPGDLKVEVRGQGGSATMPARGGWPGRVASSPMV